MAETVLYNVASAVAAELVSRYGKEFLDYWIADLTAAEAQPSNDGDGASQFVVIGLGRCGCHIAAELSEIVASRLPETGAIPNQNASQWFREMFAQSGLPGLPKPALQFEPIMLVGDIDETSFADLDGLLKKGNVPKEVKNRLLRLTYQPIAEGGVGHVPIFAEFLSRGLLSIPSYQSEAESTKWQVARDYLTSFASASGDLPRLVFYVFSTGGGTGAGSAAEIMRPQSYARNVRKIGREMYFTGVGVLPYDVVRNQRRLANTGRMLVQYLADPNIRLQDTSAYDEAPSCDGGAFVQFKDSRTDNSDHGEQFRDVLPWNGLALISNRMMSESLGEDGTEINQEHVESNANQYIAQQIFNLAAAQFPLPSFATLTQSPSTKRTSRLYDSIPMT